MLARRWEDFFSGASLITATWCVYPIQPRTPPSLLPIIFQPNDVICGGEGEGRISLLEQRGHKVSRAKNEPSLSVSFLGKNISMFMPQPKIQ